MFHRESSQCLIELLRADLGFDDQTWGDILAKAVGCRETNALNEHQVQQVLGGITKSALSKGLLKTSPATGERAGFADGLQASLINYLWSKLFLHSDAKTLRRTLRAKLQEVTGVSDLRFLSHEDGCSMIERLVELFSQSHSARPSPIPQMKAR